LGRIKLTDQFREPIRHSLSHNIVIHGAELMADPRLNLSIEPALLAWCRILAGLRLYILHDLFHVSPVKSLQRQQFLVLKAFRKEPNSINAEKFRQTWNFCRNFFRLWE
jgi:hypothetical protein